MKKICMLIGFCLGVIILLSSHHPTTIAVPIHGIKITINCPLPSGEVGQQYSARLTSTGGIEPLNWYIPSNDLPPGLSLNQKTGLISGTPASSGKYSFSIIVYDAQQNKDGPIQCGINISQPPTATPTSTPIPFNYSLNAVEDVITLDPNLYNPAGKGILKATQYIDATLISGSPRSGTITLSNIPDGIGYRCTDLTGNLSFQTTCSFFFEEPFSPPKGGEYVIEAKLPIAKFIRTDTFILVIPMLRDVSIISVKPVQVVYDADLHGITTLVKGKGTVFKATINSTYPDPVNVRFALNLPSMDWDTNPPQTGSLITTPPDGWAFPTTWGPIEISHGINEIILPYLRPYEIADEFSRYPNRPTVIEGVCMGNICGPNVRVVPRPNHTGMINYEVVIDPENTLGDANFSNNALSGSANSISTRPWNFYIIPYQDVSTGCSPEQRDLQYGAKYMLEYLLGMFPIADSELTYTIAPAMRSGPCAADPSQTCVYAESWESRSDEYSGFQDRYSFLSEISDLAISEGYDFAIAIGCGCGGGASGVPNAVFSGDCDGRRSVVIAHEFNHVVTGMGDIYSLDCFAEWDESYCEHEDGTREYYCYEDARSRRTGFIGTNCTLDGEALVCTPDQVKTCSQSCYCSIYEENWALYPRCNSIGPCDATCCRTIAEHFCADGTVYTAPDGRIFHPASAGFWVNLYYPISEATAYIMDSYNTGLHINYWMRLENTYQHCRNEVFRDGYLRLLRNTRFLDSEDPEAILISGELRKDGAAFLNPFFRMVSPSLDLLPGEGEGYSIVLMDSNSNPLSANFFEPVFRQSDPNGSDIDFFHLSYKIEWIDGTKRIELRDPSGLVLASRNVSANAPQLQILSPTGGKTHNLSTPLGVKWKSIDPDGDPLTYAVSISTDNQVSWQPLAINISTEYYDVETSSFVEGDELWIKVRVTDGVNTTTAITQDPIKLSAKPSVGSIFDIDPALFAILLLLWLLAVTVLIWGIIELSRRRKEKRNIH